MVEKLLSLEESLIIPILVLIIFIAILLFFSGVLTIKSYTPPTLEDGFGITLLECNFGECPTNLFNGTKRCPDDLNNIMLYNPEYEVCNQAKYCTNSLTPYAVNFDGSTNALGVCEGGVYCRCVRKASCSRYNTVSFNVQEGSPFIDIKGEQNYVITQISELSNSGYGYNTPEIGNLIFDACKLNPDYTSKLYGGCEYDRTNDYTKTRSILGCVTENPCQAGQFAYVVDDKDPMMFCKNPSTLEPSLIDPIYYSLGCFVHQPKTSTGLDIIPTNMTVVNRSLNIEKIKVFNNLDNNKFLVFDPPVAVQYTKETIPYYGPDDETLSNTFDGGEYPATSFNFVVKLIKRPDIGEPLNFYPVSRSSYDVDGNPLYTLSQITTIITDDIQIPILVYSDKVSYGSGDETGGYDSVSPNPPTDVTYIKGDVTCTSSPKYPVWNPAEENIMLISCDMPTYNSSTDGLQCPDI